MSGQSRPGDGDQGQAEPSVTLKGVREADEWQKESPPIES